MHKPQKFLLFISVGVLSLAMAACASSGKSATIVKNGYMNTVPPAGNIPPPSTGIPGNTNATISEGFTSSQDTYFVGTGVCQDKFKPEPPHEETGREQVKPKDMPVKKPWEKNPAYKIALAWANKKCRAFITDLVPADCDKGCKDGGLDDYFEKPTAKEGNCLSDQNKTCIFVTVKCKKQRICNDIVPVIREPHKKG